MATLQPTPWALPNGNFLWFGDTVPTLSTDGRYNAGDYLLTTASTAGLPALFRCVTGGTPGTWQEAANAARKFTSTAAAYSALYTDDVIIQTGNFAVTLPAAASYPGKSFTVKRIGAANGTVVVVAGGAIDAGTTATFGTDGAAVTLASNGTQWYVVSAFGTVSIS